MESQVELEQTVLLTSDGKSGRVRANITIDIRWEVRYLPSIGTTANVDLDLHFNVPNFEM